MNKQTHRTCVRMSAKEYSRLMERSRAAGLSANAWLMEQLAGNRPIISRNGVMSDFLCLLNQKGREINTVARAFNSGYGTNGDTELFKKSRNINGFRACRIANNLY